MFSRGPLTETKNSTGDRLRTAVTTTTKIITEETVGADINCRQRDRYSQRQLTGAGPAAAVFLSTTKSLLPAIDTEI
jgi:hypothetical protein